MSDSFFGFDTHLESDTLEEGLVSDEEDEDYDALNDETFGEDVLTGDWEEDHEKLAQLTELSRNGPREENGDLSSKIAAFILDDEPVNIHIGEHVDTIKPKPRPPPGFRIVNNGHLDPKPPLPPLTNLHTVEEIERNLIKPPVTSLRLEDLERKLIPIVNPPGLNLTSPPPYNNIGIQPHRPPLITPPPLQKMPPYQQYRIHPRLIIPPGLMSLRGVGVPFLRLAPGSGPHPLLPPHPHPAFPGGVLRGGVGGGHHQALVAEDEYSGLMTPKEKQWLTSIQLLQLGSNNPFQDDYYYVMFQHRQSGHHGRKVGCPLKPRDQQPNSKSIYTPLQFENSLGKLQVVSVIAPRKIIDTDIVESIECTPSMSSSKKVKQTLLEIEHMFSDVLLAEEAFSPLATHSTEHIDPNQLFIKNVQILLKNEKLKTVLNIRKGKALVLRILSHPHMSGALARKLVTILPSVAKKDTEQGMLRALPAIRHYLSTSPLAEIVELAAGLTPQLPFLLTNKFGISVVANLMERAEAHLSESGASSEASSAWVSGFLNEVLSAVDPGRASELERPVVGMDASNLSRHLARAGDANNQQAAALHRALSTLNSLEKQGQQRP